MKSLFRQSLVWDCFENSAGSQHVYGLTATADYTVLAFTADRMPTARRVFGIASPRGASTAA